MHPTELFVYGTLRHDQPEHKKYCRGVTGWRPARLRGKLWMVPAGYRLAVVSRQAVLLAATTDAVADEARRSALAAAEMVRASSPDDSGWIDGELLSFRDATEAWPPLDAWEEFVPGRGGCYARAVVPVEIAAAAGETPGGMAAWAYIATVVPDGSAAL